MPGAGEAAQIVAQAGGVLSFIKSLIVSEPVSALLLLLVSVAAAAARKRVLEIRDQLRANGGHSFHDKLTHSIKEIESRLENLDSQVAFSNSWDRFLFDSRAAFATDPHGSIIWVSKGMLKLTGYARGDLEGTRWQTAVHPADIDGVLARMTLCLEAGGKYHDRYRIVTAERDIKEVQVEAELVDNSQGKLIGMVGLMEEVLRDHG